MYVEDIKKKKITALPSRTPNLMKQKISIINISLNDKTFRVLISDINES